MSPKAFVKTLLLGPPGIRPRNIRLGLLKGNRFNIDTSSKSSRLLGLDELEIAQVLRNYAAEARTAADVGMNDGWYAVYFAQLPNVKRVFGFEPDTSLQKETQANLALNSPTAQAKVMLVNKFAGNKVDEQWCRLDDVLAGAAEPILLKIDVEGGELDVLKGAENLLKTRRVSIVLETHTAELEKQCIGFLKDLGYQARIIDKGWYRAILKEQRELAHNRWFVAWK